MLRRRFRYYTEIENARGWRSTFLGF